MNSDITLTDEQFQALEAILEFLDCPTKRLLTLSGVAGTGKTTLLQYLIQSVSEIRSVAITAPTNKAVKVLREMAKGSQARVNCSTTFSLFNLRVDRGNEIKAVNYENGRRVENISAGSFQFDTVIVDEASMVSAGLFKYLMRFLDDHDRMRLTVERKPLKFIFVGDPLQLPPVHEDVSLAFTTMDQLVTLETVVRQALDNPIIRFTERIRQSIRTGEHLTISTDANGAEKGVWAMKAQTWDWILDASYMKSEYRKDQQCYRAIAYRNARVDHLNRRIRGLLYDNKTETPFVAGERVLAHTPVFDPVNVDSMILPTDEEALITDISVRHHPIHRDVLCWRFYLLIDSEETGEKNISVYSPHPDGENRFIEHSRTYEEDKAWKLKNDFEDSFARLRPVHAMTSHKSQGSTFQKVFVDADDILSIPDRILALKSLYVAVSRASEKVAIKWSGA